MFLQCARWLLCLAHVLFILKVEDNFQEGQEKEDDENKENIKSEDDAIEMSEDFKGQMHDGDEKKEGQFDHQINSQAVLGMDLQKPTSVYSFCLILCGSS